MSSQEYLAIDLPSRARVLRTISSCIEALAESCDDLMISERIIYEINLATHEVCANIVEHAYSEQAGRIAVNIWINRDESQICIEIKDQGQPFSLESVPAPNLSVPQTNGYGLFIVRQLMDSVTYRSENATNTWRLIKKFES